MTLEEKLAAIDAAIRAAGEARAAAERREVVTGCTNCMAMLEDWADTCDTCMTDAYIIDRTDPADMI